MMRRAANDLEVRNLILQHSDFRVIQNAISNTSPYFVHHKHRIIIVVVAPGIPSATITKLSLKYIKTV
jgi:hypothetical protein